MNSNIYEAHITFNEKDKDNVKDISRYYKNWSFSYINGDIILGEKKPFCYLTSHRKDKVLLLYEMNGLTTNFYEIYRVKPVRCKIEEIIYDTKMGIDRVWLK